MSKISGSYDSLILGVSQQVPQDRREGQNTEQVNFISDPVRGLARRHGSILEDEDMLAVVDEEHIGVTLQDVRNFRSYDFVIGTSRYSLFYRHIAKPGNSQAPDFFCVNKETRKFIPVNTSPSDARLLDFTRDGLSAITAAGEILIAAGQTVTPSITITNNWDNSLNRSRAAVWIRSGFYSRKYNIKLSVRELATNTVTLIDAEYTTKASSYPLLLDTSDILASDPEYQKKVNDRTNEYNSNVTKWIGEAAADIVPQNIAQKLLEDLVLKRDAEGLTSADVDFFISNTTIGIKTASDFSFTIESITATDAGDGTGIRAVHIEVASPDLLVPEHFEGQVVRILPQRKDEKDAYYVRAVPDDGQTGTNLVKVTWREDVGQRQTPGSTFIYATVTGGVFHVASSLSILGSLTGLSDLPELEPSTVGDVNTAPTPNFFGKKITYLGVFQDRLVVGSNSVLTFSRNGDYLNFFRRTVLSIAADDPVEIFSLGSEDDTLLASTTYNQDLVIFGKRKQYLVNGRQVLSPQTANITVFSAYEDAAESYPKTLGNFIFHTQFRNGFASLHQIQPGAIVESPESYNASQQVSKYLLGKPVEMLSISTPNYVILRTEGLTNGVYLYNFLDTGRERAYDSWSTWKWDERLGQILGMTFDRGNLLFAMLRYGLNRSGELRYWVALERFSTDTELSQYPYLDSLRTLSTYQVTSQTFLHSTADLDETAAAFAVGIREQFLGQPLSNLASLLTQYPQPEKQAKLWVGYQQPAFVVPTNPYVRDDSGKSIVNGIFTITLFTLSLTDTSGIKFFVETKGKGKVKTGEWNGRQIGRLSAELGIQPVSTGKVIAPIGCETREFKAYIEAKDWLPLTVSSIEWQGQFFYNSRRG